VITQHYVYRKIVIGADKRKKQKKIDDHY